MLGDSNERTRYLDTFLLHSRLRERRGRDAHATLKTWPSFAPIWNLDKVFLNEPCGVVHYEVVRNKLTRIASDHLPVKVIARIDW
jgi:endonuclease/exonuclease/phosphatase family metal-dependent hydrolase